MRERQAVRGTRETPEGSPPKKVPQRRNDHVAVSSSRERGTDQQSMEPMGDFWKLRYRRRQSRNNGRRESTQKEKATFIELRASLSSLIKQENSIHNCLVYQRCIDDQSFLLS
mmetsp:Transcript_20836/g.49290  ORF Transcript_20836/g.49290 Transcript_20836/m.49290 type:complete len:113 (+) Transcript_20836:786-1124(+)